MACHSSRDTTLGILMTSSSLQVAQVIGHVDGVPAQRLQRHHVQGSFVGAGQHHRRGAPVLGVPAAS